MDTYVESLDGNQHDVAGPADVTALPLNVPRVYLAQGRRMAMHVVSTRERQFFGEPHDFVSPLVAVEVDETRQLLFSLTQDTDTGQPDPLDPGKTFVIPGELRVYRITTPSTPLKLQTIDTVQGKTLGGVDIRVIPEDEKLLLIHRLPPPSPVWRVTVFDYASADALTEIQHVDLPNPLLADTCPEDPLERKVVSLSRCVVQVDGAAGPGVMRRVFLRAAIQHTRVAPEIQKGAQGIVAIQLDSLYTQAPTFYSHVFDAYPCPVPTDPVTGADVPPRKWAVRDLDLVKQGSHWYLCAVGAPEFGAKVFLLDNFDAIGFDRYQEEAYFGTSGVHDDLVAANVVDDSLAILAGHYSIAVEIQNLSNSVVTPTGVGQGPQGDTLVMKEGTPSSSERKLWNASNVGTDYPLKIQDVSDLSSGPPILEDTLYAPGASDTSVYVPEVGSVYCTSFNGVVRYDVAFPPDAIPDYASYVPAVDPLSGTLLVIEHLIAAQRSWSGGAWQLFGQAAIGGFTQWGVKTDGQLELLGFVDGVAAGAWPAGWLPAPAGGSTYGQDVEFGIDPNNGHEILVTDFYRFDTKEIAINLYDLTAGAWGSYALGPADALGNPIVEATSWDVTLDGEWVFVGGEGGFFVLKLGLGSPVSNLQFMDYALTYDAQLYPAGPVGPPGQAGWSFQQVRGIQRAGDRLFVSLSDGVAGHVNGFALAMYEFHPDTSGGSNLGDVGDTPLAVLFDGASGQPNNFPGILLTGGGRLRSYTYGNETQLFCGTQNGYVLQASYFQHSDEMAGAPLRYWHNGSFYNEAGDCPAVNVAAPGATPSLRLTVSKFLETFAIVEPFGWD